MTRAVRYPAGSWSPGDGCESGTGRNEEAGVAANLSDIWVYPLKSGAGVRREQVEVGAHGFELDRRWMIVDDDGEFLTQRSHPELVLVEPTVGSDHLVLERPVTFEPAEGPSPSRTRIELPRRPSDDETRRVEVWGDRVESRHVAREADRWLSSFLGVDCELVYIPDVERRRSSADEDDDGRGIAFADKYPFLLTSRASLDALNGRLEAPLAMQRFRPNLVVEGVDAFAEDDWSHLRLGDVQFRVAEPCTRCSVTTVDPETGRTGDEPLETLAEFRRTDDGVAFGQYLVQLGAGRLTVDDPVDVVTSRG